DDSGCAGGTVGGADTSSGGIAGSGFE
ncbi:hypothetical protein A2U01_0101864, partial [Trifolium medium]|nr:hypothetical protein [Trifolium medium]